MLLIYQTVDVPLHGCKKLKNEGKTKSGVYRINLNDGKGQFDVFCDMNLLQGDGWTIIQRRVDNTTSFNRNRTDYNCGFGNLNGNFWLGLENIKRITDSAPHELYIGLESFKSGPAQLAKAKYGSFSLGTDATDYPITVSQFDQAFSTAGDAFVNHNGEKFSTPDEDNDSTATRHCAGDYSSGWWFHDCIDSHLNGIYYWDGVYPSVTPPLYDGVSWMAFLQDGDSALKTVVMAVRPA